MDPEAVYQTTWKDANGDVYVRTEMYYANHNKRFEQTSVNGKRHGIQFEGYENGQIRWMRTWFHGVKHGTERRFEFTGIEFERNEWVMGKQHGWQSLLDDYLGHVHHTKYEHGDFRVALIENLEGMRMTETHHLNGEMHGLYYRRCRDGNTTEGWYSDGRKHGTWFERDKDGKELSCERFHMGYPRNLCEQVLYRMRRRKWARLAKLVTTQPFVEWWYDPKNTGGKIAKRQLEHSVEFASRKRQCVGDTPWVSHKPLFPLWDLV